VVTKINPCLAYTSAAPTIVFYNFTQTSTLKFWSRTNRKYYFEDSFLEVILSGEKMEISND